MRTYTRIVSSPAHADVLVLTYDQRLKSRFYLKRIDADEIQVMLPRGLRPESGQCLEAEDGSILRVVCAVEDLSTVFAQGHDLARACYHLGNRHLPLAIRADRASYLQDAVIDDMMKGLGFEVRHERNVFEPESGAYTSHSHHAVLSHRPH